MRETKVLSLVEENGTISDKLASLNVFWHCHRTLDSFIVQKNIVMRTEACVLLHKDGGQNIISVLM